MDVILHVKNLIVYINQATNTNSDTIKPKMGHKDETQRWDTKMRHKDETQR